MYLLSALYKALFVCFSFIPVPGRRLLLLLQLSSGWRRCRCSFRPAFPVKVERSSQPGGAGGVRLLRGDGRLRPFPRPSLRREGGHQRQAKYVINTYQKCLTSIIEVTAKAGDSKRRSKGKDEIFYKIFDLSRGFLQSEILRNAVQSSGMCVVYMIPVPQHLMHMFQSVHSEPPTGNEIRSLLQHSRVLTH